MGSVVESASGSFLSVPQWLLGPIYGREREKGAELLELHCDVTSGIQ